MDTDNDIPGMSSQASGSAWGSQRDQFIAASQGGEEVPQEEEVNPFSLESAWDD